MSVTVRTRGALAYASVVCSEGQLHRFSIGLDGAISNTHHDPADDDVIVSLGGRPSPCGQVVLAFHAARTTYLANIGEQDSPIARFSRGRGWRTGADCSACPQWGVMPIGHALSVEHQLDSAGYADLIPAARTMLRWMHRTGQDKRVVRNQEHLRQILPGLNSRRNFWIAPRTALVTEPFIAAAADLVEGDYEAIRHLRVSGGVRTQWVKEIGRRLQPQARQRLLHHLDSLPGGRSGITAILTPARNLPARDVARFLNAGIYAHLHTYIRAGVRPSQVLAIYRTSNGAHTLAEFLQRGMTVRQAMRACEAAA